MGQLDLWRQRVGLLLQIAGVARLLGSQISRAGEGAEAVVLSDKAHDLLVQQAEGALACSLAPSDRAEAVAADEIAQESPVPVAATRDARWGVEGQDDGPNQGIFRLTAVLREAKPVEAGDVAESDVVGV